MTAKKLFPVDLGLAIEQWTAQLTLLYRPTNDLEIMLIAAMARAAAKIDHAEKLKIIDVERCMERAVYAWDDDRMHHIHDLAGHLSSDCERVARALSWSKQGVEYLARHWRGLRETLAATGGWDEAQKSLAFDLLGIRQEHRAGCPRLRPDADTAELAQLVESELARLQKRLDDFLLALDEADQAAAAVGMPVEEDGITKQLRRYELEARSQYNSAKRALLQGRARAAEAAQPSDAPVTPSAGPAPAAAGKKKTTGPCPTPRPRTSQSALNYLMERARLLSESTAARPAAEHEPAEPASHAANDDEDAPQGAQPAAEPVSRPDHGAASKRQRRELRRRMRAQKKGRCHK
jgi:hypothetical protein